MTRWSGFWEILAAVLVVLALAASGCGEITEAPGDGELRGRADAGAPGAGGAPQVPPGSAGGAGAPFGTGGAAALVDGAAPGAGGAASPSGTGGAVPAGLGGAQAPGAGGSGPGASFSQPGSSCDARTGAQLGGGNCGPRSSCQWACAQSTAPEWRGAGEGQCQTDVYSGGRSCAGGPCGQVRWSNGAVQMLNCAVGTTCQDLGADREFPPEQDGGDRATARAECRRYCLSDADCGAGTCLRAALPCPLAGGTYGAAPAPVPAIGVCVGEAQVWTCDRVGPL